MMMLSHIYSQTSDTESGEYTDSFIKDKHECFKRHSADLYTQEKESGFLPLHVRNTAT